MKLISLTRGLSAKVDDADFEKLNKLKWYAAQRTGHPGIFYAYRNSTSGKNKQKKVAMHTIIMKPAFGFITDHRNNDTLDNQRHNLRNCDGSQNMSNRSSARNSTSKYLGVCRSKNTSNKIWVASIKKNKKTHYLGSFDNEIDAAKAYDKKAKEFHGEFANLNFK